MTGYNELLLNGDTMIEVLQFWLNAQMITAPRVTAVEIENRISSTGVMFRVRVVSGEPQCS